MERPCGLRMMRVEDAEEASSIERASHGDAWPGTNFDHELRSNPVARYVVLEGGEGAMVGFAGMWIQLDEAHVVNVAVRPEERGRGYGRVLVHALVDLAMQYQMSVATLECRESNAVARRLYASYGFYEVGVRKAYYSDTGEAAVIMTTEDLSSVAYQERLIGLAARLGDRLPGAPITVDRESIADLREPEGR